MARYAAKLAGCYPTDPADCAAADAVFEFAQEMCTINPLVNCYAGDQYEQVKRWYFASFPTHLRRLERQLDTGPFFAGQRAPTFADFNVLHMLLNAEVAEPGCVPPIPATKQLAACKHEACKGDTIPARLADAASSFGFKEPGEPVNVNRDGGRTEVAEIIRRYFA